MGWNKFEMFSTSQIFSNTSLSENLVKFYLNYFKDKPNIKTRKFQFLNSSSKEEDIKLYIRLMTILVGYYILNIRVKVEIMVISIGGFLLTLHAGRRSN